MYVCVCNRISCELIQKRIIMANCQHNRPRPRGSSCKSVTGAQYSMMWQVCSTLQHINMYRAPLLQLFNSITYSIRSRIPIQSARTDRSHSVPGHMLKSSYTNGLYPCIAPGKELTSSKRFWRPRTVGLLDA